MMLGWWWVGGGGERVEWMMGGLCLMAFKGGDGGCYD